MFTGTADICQRARDQFRERFCIFIEKKLKPTSSNDDLLISVAILRRRKVTFYSLYIQNFNGFIDIYGNIAPSKVTFYSLFIQNLNVCILLVRMCDRCGISAVVIRLSVFGKGSAVGRGASVPSVIFISDPSDS